MAEPLATSLLLLVFGVLLAVSAVFAGPLARRGVPFALLFLVLGMLAGSEGPGGVAFDDHLLAFRLGTFALIVILFDGGLNTTPSALRSGLAPASVLATVGVLGAAGVVALVARLIGFDWPEALLIGAIVSSTDAAAVFGVLRGGRLHLRPRVASTLELESGLNDPVAVILVTAFTASLAGDAAPLGWRLLLDIPLQLLIGLAVGLAFGYLMRIALQRVRLASSGLFPAVSLAGALAAFGVATLVNGSGFLAVFVVAFIIGNSSVPALGVLRRIHDSIAWLAQIAMFLTLGLLVFPSELLEVLWPGVALGLALAFFARPLATALCLAPFGFNRREIGYAGWVGLRGAVPIILATIPVLAQVDPEHRIFNTVFIIVVVNAIIPGATVHWLTRRLGLAEPEPPTPAAALEINSMQPLRGKVVSFFVDETLAVANVALSKIPFPQDSAVILVVREGDVIAPRGATVLRPGDHVYVLAAPGDEGYVHLLFGRAQNA